MVQKPEEVRDSEEGFGAQLRKLSNAPKDEPIKSAEKPTRETAGFNFVDGREPTFGESPMTALFSKSDVAHDRQSVSGFQ